MHWAEAWREAKGHTQAGPKQAGGTGQAPTSSRALLQTGAGQVRASTKAHLRYTAQLRRENLAHLRSRTQAGTTTTPHRTTDPWVTTERASTPTHKSKPGRPVASPTKHSTTTKHPHRYNTQAAEKLQAHHN